MQFACLVEAVKKNTAFYSKMANKGFMRLKATWLFTESLQVPTATDFLKNKT